MEFDVTFYKYISIFSENLESTFILNFSLPEYFPQDVFILSMSSIYHMTDQGKPQLKQIKDFPYSPRWEPKKMVVKILEHILVDKVQITQEL